MFPVIEAVHLLALALLGGTVLVVDLRLLGWGLPKQPIRDLARELQPWMLASVAILLVSGPLMFVSKAFKCYESPPFRLEMSLFAVALLFTFTIRRKVTLSERAGPPSWLAGVTGITSIALLDRCRADGASHRVLVGGAGSDRIEYQPTAGHGSGVPITTVNAGLDEPPDL